MDPLEILPEDSWRDVINRVDTAEGLLTAYNTCRLWRSFLRERETEWMFKGVFPLLLKYLPASDILNARRICKCWRKVIDSYFVSQQSSILTPGGPGFFVHRKSLRIFKVDFLETEKRFQISEQEVLERFMADFNNGNATNPFVSRSLHLRVTELTLRVLLHFFEKFGHHLDSLELFICPIDLLPITTPLQLAKLVWDILGFVPNLKRLVLLTVQCSPHPLVPPSQEENQLRTHELEKFLTSTSAPPLPRLNNLQMYVPFGSMREALEREYCPQLIKYYFNTAHRFPPPENLFHLTELAWQCLSTIEVTDPSTLKNLNCPLLQRLQIMVKSCQGPKGRVVCAERLFEAVESFKASLTHFSLYWTFYEPHFPRQLNLPLVQEVCLEIGDIPNVTAINFSFLVHLKSLRKFSCVFWQASYDEISEFCKDSAQDENQLLVEEIAQDETKLLMEGNVDLHYYLNCDRKEVYKSNVWRLVPSLNLIEIYSLEHVYPAKAGKFAIFTRDRMRMDNMHEQ